jgi:hypothetical protein
MKQKTVEKRQKQKSGDLGEEGEDNEEEKDKDENDDEDEEEVDGQQQKEEEIRMEEADGQDGARIAQIGPCGNGDETVMDKEGEEEDCEQWDETLADLVGKFAYYTLLRPLQFSSPFAYSPNWYLHSLLLLWVTILILCAESWPKFAGPKWPRSRATRGRLVGLQKDGWFNA